MTKMKIGSVVLTGIGAYLIISKGIYAVKGMVHDISEAVKWRAYYECKRPDPLAPGYERVSDCEATKDGGTPSKPEKTVSSEKLGEAMGDAVRKAVDNLFDRREEDETDEYDGEEMTAEETSPDTEEAIPTTNEAEDEENETVG